MARAQCPHSRRSSFFFLDKGKDALRHIIAFWCLQIILSRYKGACRAKQKSFSIFSHPRLFLAYSNHLDQFISSFALLTRQWCRFVWGISFSPTNFTRSTLSTLNETDLLQIYFFNHHLSFLPTAAAHRRILWPEWRARLPRSWGLDTRQRNHAFPPPSQETRRSESLRLISGNLFPFGPIDVC